MKLATIKSILETDLGTMLIRPLQACDAYVLWNWTSDNDFNKGLLWPQPSSRVTVIHLVDRWLRRMDQYSYAVVNKHTGALNAITYFKPLDTCPDSPMEMTLMVAPYAASNLGQIITNQLSFLVWEGEGDVVARHMKDNEAASKVLRRARYEEHIMDGIIRDETGKDRAYTLLRYSPPR